MSKDDVDRVRRGYEMFGRGELDRLADELFHPDTVWVEPDTEGFAFRGTHRGIASVKREIWQRSAELFDGFHITCDAFLDAGDRVVVLGTFRGTGRETGEPLEARFASFWTLRDGRVARSEHVTDTAAHIRAVGGAVVA